MRVARGYVHQVPSGQGNLLSAPRVMDSLWPVLVALGEVEIRSERYGRTWRASLNDMNHRWALVYVGWITNDKVAPEWDESLGWQDGRSPDSSTERVLIHFPSQTLYLRQSSRFKTKPKSVIGTLQNLLNLALQRVDPNADWVIRLGLQQDVQSVDAALQRMSQLTKLRIELSVPNARMHDDILSLAGVAAAAKAEDLVTEMKSKKGMDKESEPVETARRLTGEGLAEMAVYGRDADGERVSASSKGSDNVRIYRIEDEDTTFSLADTNRLVSEVPLLSPDDPTDEMEPQANRTSDVRRRRSSGDKPPEE